jgi:uncharacterized membrane protein
MGKRSRKRTGAATAAGAATDVTPPAGGSTRAQRDAVRARRAEAARRRAAEPASARPQRRPRGGERPPAPWGKFPLVELCVLLAIVLLIAGFVIGGNRGPTMIFAGLVLGSLGGLELSIREHFAGYRSHTTLLAAAVAVFVGTVVAVIAGKILLPVLLAVALAVFGGAFLVFRRAFRRRSGGVSFR